MDCETTLKAMEANLASSTQAYQFTVTCSSSSFMKSEKNSQICQIVPRVTKVLKNI